MSKNLDNRCKQYRTWLYKSPVLAEGLEGNPVELCRLWEDTRENCDVWINQEEKIIAGISTYVLAPSLNSFVVWVLQNAIKKGIRKLYFLARDGYFMYHCAIVLCRKWNLPIECRYLYCSRYSLRIPFYHLNMEEAMEYICRGGIDVTRRKIVDRSGISKQKQHEVMEILGYTDNADEVVPYAELERIRKELETCEFFRKNVEENSKKELPLLKQYLEQEGVLENEKAALVDSGWVGSMQKTLNRLLKEFGCDRELEGYYWGLYELPEGIKKESYHSYYFHSNKGLKEKVYFSNCLFEAIFSAPHGMTVGYQREGSKIVPVLGMFAEERKKFLKATGEYLKQYTECFSLNIKKKQIENGKKILDIDSRSDLKIIKKLMAEFMGHPVREEAEVYGTLRFSDDIMDDAKKQTTELLNEKELRENHVFNKTLNMLGIRHGYIKESAWYEGSAALHGEHVKYHRRQYACYKYLLYLRQTYWKKRK